MFSATAIMRAPRTSWNSRVDCATDTAATATSTMATTSTWNTRNCPARLRILRDHLGVVFTMTNKSFAYSSVTRVTDRSSIAEHHKSVIGDGVNRKTTRVGLVIAAIALMLVTACGVTRGGDE